MSRPLTLGGGGGLDEQHYSPYRADVPPRYLPRVMSCVELGQDRLTDMGR